MLKCRLHLYASHYLERQLDPKENLKWWSLTNIAAKSEDGIIKMIEGLHSEWKELYTKQQGLANPAEQMHKF